MAVAISLDKCSMLLNENGYMAQQKDLFKSTNPMALFFPSSRHPLQINIKKKAFVRFQVQKNITKGPLFYNVYMSTRCYYYCNCNLFVFVFCSCTKLRHTLTSIKTNSAIYTYRYIEIFLYIYYLYIFLHSQYLSGKVGVRVNFWNLTVFTILQHSIDN